MTLTEYETTVIVRPDIGGDSVEATLDRVRDIVRQRGGKLLAINHWGKRKLAYEIKKQTRGVFVHNHFLGDNTLVAELERNLRINDNVLRFMTVRMNKFVEAEDRNASEYVRPQYDAPEEPETDDTLQQDLGDQAATKRDDGDEDGHEEADGSQDEEG